MRTHRFGAARVARERLGGDTNRGRVEMLETAAPASDEDVGVVAVRGRTEDGDRRRRDPLQHVDKDSRRLGAAAAEIDDRTMQGAGRAEPIRQELAQQDGRIDEHVVVGRRIRRAVDRCRRQSGRNAPARGHLEGDSGGSLLPAVEIHERARTIHDSRARPQEPPVVGPSPLVRIPQSGLIANRDSRGAIRIDDPGNRRILLDGQGLAGGADGDDVTDVLPGVHEPIGTRCPIGNDEAGATGGMRDLQLNDVRRPVGGDGDVVIELWSRVLRADERDEQQDQIATCTTRSLPDFLASYIA